MSVYFIEDKINWYLAGKYHNDLFYKAKNFSYSKVQIIT